MTAPEVGEIARARFWSRVGEPDANGCWPWLGNLYQGYGSFGFLGKSMKAHRASFLLAGNEIPPRFHIDHMCRNKACVNPTHLRAVDARTNSLENSDSVTAKNAAKTHCKRGHALTPDNLQTYPLKQGLRSCLICSRQHYRNYRKRVAIGSARKDASA